MKKNYLFPNSFKIVGMVITAVAFIALIIWRLLEISPEFKMPAVIEGDFFGDCNYFCMADCGLLTFIIPVLITGLIFIGFSKEKIEDEFVKSIREQSLVWATYCAAILLVVFTLTIYSWSYLYAMYSIFPLFLILFIIKFRVELYKANKGGAQ
ncbi:MAG: hypothetical protein IJK92_02270 [Bacteroidales bacterium]|nr:hypothetical protein [Bacteroidales bacterium]